MIIVKTLKQNPLKINIKYFSTSSKDYTNNLDFLYDKHSIGLKQPFFELRSGQIEILHDPIDFYIHLHKGIKSAGQRITLSSLYLGTGNLEKFLVANLDNKLKKSKKLKLQMLFDYNRGTRVDKRGDSSRAIIEHLRTNNLHNNNVRLGFFKNPNVNKLIGLDEESGLREIFGVHHIKCQLFDNDILLSGANLNQTYFTERQDRYYYIRNAPEMANYMDDLISVIMNNSYQINDQAELKMYNDQPGPEKRNAFKKVYEQQFKMFLFSNRLKMKKKSDFEKFYNVNDDQPQQQPQKEENNEPIEEQNEQKSTIKDKLKEKLDAIIPEYEQKQQELQIALEEKKQQAKTILEQSYDEVEVSNIVRRIDQSLYQKNQKGDLIEMGGKVYIFPTIQNPIINYKKDEEFYEQFLEYNTQKKDNKVNIATGYLCFTKKVTEILSKSVNSEVNILTAAPQANSFYQAGRVKGWIPYFYRVFEYNFLKKLKSQNNQNIRLYEYEKNQWTFHSKGMWISEDKSDLPNVTVVGSSNYSYRSYNRDTEINFCMYTVCDKFKKELLLEQQKQYAHTHDKTKQDLSKDPDMKLSLFTRWFSKLFQSFL